MVRNFACGHLVTSVTTSQITELSPMRIGCPTEIKNHEYRVGLTPESARELIASGSEVWIESGAGMGIVSGSELWDFVMAGRKADMLLLHVEFERPVPPVATNARGFDAAKWRWQVANVF